MKKITSLIFAVLFLFPSLALAQGSLSVEFEATPLFEDANFLPGQSISRWTKVLNNSGKTQRIAVEAINVSNSDKLGDVLVLTIKEGDSERYKNDLSRFFNAGEVYLSDLADGQTVVYDFSVSFWPEANNSFQGKELGFDILIGFQGTEGGITPGGGTGGGGYLPPGLIIQDEAVISVDLKSAIINWTTSYPSTSQVVWSEDGQNHTLDLTDTLKYGYAKTTLENETKTILHSVVIDGLKPSTKYHFRCISHGSLAVSVEHSFTTLSVGQESPDPVLGEEIGKSEGQIKGAYIGKFENELKPDPEEPENLESSENQNKPALKEEKLALNKLFAGLMGALENFKLFCPAIIIALALFFIFFFYSVKKWWLILAVAIILLIIYALNCSYLKIVLPVFVIIMLIIYIFMVKKP